jgi:hypothetical protein
MYIYVALKLYNFSSNNVCHDWIDANLYIRAFRPMIFVNLQQEGNVLQQGLDVELQDAHRVSEEKKNPIVSTGNGN